jgi:hypothetical protein
MADFLFPLQFKRQYAAPLDIDIVFSTTAERLSYLTNPRRYPGQVVSDLQTESVYILNSAGTNWKEAGGNSTFTQNLTVSLEGTKTFGRYVDGDIIDSIGKTPSQVIQMSVVEPIKPIITLTSPTTIAFNQTNINNVINFTHVIKSLGATVNTASLQFRRNNTGSWNILGTGTASTSSYNHILTDTPFNTQSFNYRYIVTDTVGAMASAALAITPTPYSNPTVPAPTIVAFNTPLTSPETNTSREKGNVNSNISATITRNSPNVDLVNCIFQYKEDNGSWISIGTPISISGPTATVTLTNHIPLSTVNNVYYRLSAYDGYQTTVGNQSTLSLYNIIFYGSSSSTPTNSSQVRSLPNRIFTNGSNPFDLFTGIVNTKFTVAMPNNLSITGVIDLDASNANLTNSYVNNPFSVNDYAGTSYSYKVYTCSIATPYTPTEHRHRVTRG